MEGCLLLREVIKKAIKKGSQGKDSCGEAGAAGRLGTRARSHGDQFQRAPEMYWN